MKARLALVFALASLAVGILPTAAGAGMHDGHGMKAAFSPSGMHDGHG